MTQWIVNPQSEDDYFRSGINNLILSEMPVYSPGEVFKNSRLLSNVPQLLTINLSRELSNLHTCLHPELNMDIEDIINMACYYYCDWDSVVAVMDEIISPEQNKKLQDMLVYSSQEAYDNVMAVMTGGVTQFVAVIIGFLSKANSPAIMNYGSIYRLHSISTSGLVAFLRSSNEDIAYAFDNAIW